jgi:predicted NBD/HSP70 family sugar kinase
MIYLGFDIGGTKIRGYRVIPNYDSKNNLVDVKLHENVFDEPELNTKNFKEHDKLEKYIEKQISRFGNPDEVVIAGAIAGIINKETLSAICANIHYPINFLGNMKNRGYKTFAYNDLYTQGTSNSRLGIGKNYSRVAVQNIGSGNNIAFAINGKVTTEGTEAGHISDIDGGIFCGCGGTGHLETYASGNGAALMAKTYFLARPNERNHLILEEALKDWNLENNKNKKLDDLKDDSLFREMVFYIQGKHVISAYSKDKTNNPQKEIRRLQRNSISKQLGIITSFYRPELIIIRGSFVTEHWNDLGKPSVERFLNNYNRFVHPDIEKPIIQKKSIKRDGVKGAVLCAIDELENEDNRISVK